MYQQRRSMPGGESIPENYSGNAFRYPPIGSLGGTPPEEGEPTPSAEEAREQEARRPLAVVPLERTEPREGSGGFLRLLGSEEWLLLGLCLLLMGEGGPRIGGEGQKNDLLPYLLLLLFCG